MQITGTPKELADFVLAVQNRPVEREYGDSERKYVTRGQGMLNPSTKD